MLTHSDNNREGYIGEFKNGAYHGQGTYIFPNGDKYIGEWKDDKKNGLGTLTWADGSSENGYYLNDKFVPTICEDMGLKKGSADFGQCVLKLMDD